MNPVHDWNDPANWPSRLSVDLMLKELCALAILRAAARHDAPTLAKHSESTDVDPLAGVPLRGWLRIAWAATKAGMRDAWRVFKAGPPL